jgi:hypothetical protein
LFKNEVGMVVQKEKLLLNFNGNIALCIYSSIKDGPSIKALRPWIFTQQNGRSILCYAAFVVACSNIAKFSRALTPSSMQKYRTIIP